MKVLCTYCETEGRSSFLREKEPLNDPSVTHGICPDHYRQLLEEIADIAAQEPPRLRGRIPRILMELPVTGRTPQFPGIELRGMIRNLGPQGVMADLPLRVTPGTQVALAIQTWQDTLEIQGQVVWTSGGGGCVHHGISFLAPLEPGLLPRLFHSRLHEQMAV
jgi:hypothetical protein